MTITDTVKQKKPNHKLLEKYTVKERTRKQKADILNWAMLFSAIALTSAFLGARAWSAICEAAQRAPSGSNMFSGMFALALMFQAGLVSFIVSE